MEPVFPKSNSINEPEFLTRIAQSDKSAARECIDAYGAMIWTLAKQFSPSNEAAECAVQEIFIDIWENAAFCDLTVFGEEVWITMIANRRLEKYATKTKL